MYVFHVSDTGTRALHVQAALTEFTQAPDGRVTFSPPGPLSAASWVSVQQVSFDLSPGDTAPVTVTVSVPPRHEPGERYVGLIFRVPAEPADGNVAVSGAIGIQFLVNVPGEVIRSIGVGPLTATRFSDGGPIRLTLKVRNLGNVHRDYVQPDNLAASVVGKTKIPFGDFTVLADDGRGHMVTVEARFIVFPFRLLGGVLIAAAGLFLLTRRRVRRRGRHTHAALELTRKKAYEPARD